MFTDEEVVARIFAHNPVERESLSLAELKVVGLGSVGSALSAMAARAGVSRFTLVDHDQLTPENISRHSCDLASLGERKVDAVAALIRRINPQAEVIAIGEDFRTMDPEVVAVPGVAERTVLIGATDSFECQSLLNLLALETGLPALFVGCWGEAAIGEILFVVPGKTACFECYAGFRREATAFPKGDARRYTDLDFDPTKVPGQAGLWPNILIICGFAFQLLLGLLGKEPQRELIDFDHNLLLANISDFDSPLPVWSVTPARVKRGCPVCDDSCLAALSVEAVT